MQGPRFVALALPVTLLMGVAIGYALGSHAPSPGPADGSGSARRDAGSLERSEVRDPVPLAPAAPLPARDGQTAELSAASTRRAVSTLRRVEATLGSSTEEQSGRESIRGIVLGPDGAPLPGATVVAELGAYSAGAGYVRDSSSVGLAWEDADESAYVQQATVMLRRRESRRVATSAADGRFEVTGLRDREYLVRAYLEGHESEHVSVPAGAVDIALTMRRVGVFLVDVRTPSGAPAEEAAVAVQGDSFGQNLFRWSRESPGIRIESRSARLFAVAGKRVNVPGAGLHAEFSSDPRTIDLSEDGPGPHLFELEARDAIAVTVVSPEGRARPLQFEVTALRDDHPAELEFLGMMGRFVLPDPEPGTYEIRVKRSDDPEPTTATLVHEGGWSDMTVAIAPADASDFVVVHVTDPEGRGVPGVRFASEAASSSRRFRPGLMQPRTRPDGEYWIPWNSLTGGEATAPKSTVLVATSLEFGSIRAEITGPEARVSMQFMEAAKCEVQVNGEIDGPYEVSLEPAASAADPLLRVLSRSSLVAAVPDDGVVTLGPVQPGDYILSIREKSSTGRPRATDPVSKAVAISSGLTRLSIEVPSEHDLLVTVASDGARPTRGLSATREGVRGPARGRHAPESYDGATARFEGLLPGEYRLSRIGSEGVLEEMIVEVPCAPVTFTPMRATGLIVTRGSTDGPFGPAELEPGDVVTGFDGVSAADRRFFLHLEEALKERDVTLRFERGGVQQTAVLARDPDVTQGTLQVSVRFKTRLE